MSGTANPSEIDPGNPENWRDWNLVLELRAQEVADRQKLPEAGQRGAHGEMEKEIPKICDRCGRSSNAKEKNNGAGVKEKEETAAQGGKGKAGEKRKEQQSSHSSWGSTTTTTTATGNACAACYAGARRQTSADMADSNADSPTWQQNLAATRLRTKLKLLNCF